MGKLLEATLGGQLLGQIYTQNTQNDKMHELRMRLVRAQNEEKKVVAVSGVEPPTPRI
jgi:hypothetical protein